MKWDIIVDSTKPLLLISLLLYYISNAKINYFILSALLLSLIGDILLIFQDKNALYFIFGLVAFLAAHICYIMFFLKEKSRIGNKNWSFFILIAALIYGTLLVNFLYPKLGEMKLPVIVYAATICTMLITALHIKVNKFFAIGATFFVLSDSLLAINKFYASFTGATFLIMLTYGLAQAFIVTGVVKQKS